MIGEPRNSLLAINDAGAGREHGREAVQLRLHLARLLHRYPPHVNRAIEVRIVMQCPELLDLQILVERPDHTVSTVVAVVCRTVCVTVPCLLL